VFSSDPDTPEGDMDQQDLEERRSNSPSKERSSEMTTSDSHTKKTTTSWHSLENEVIFRKLATSSRGLSLKKH
jgi:hypothetical protein